MKVIAGRSIICQLVVSGVGAGCGLGFISCICPKAVTPNSRLRVVTNTARFNTPSLYPSCEKGGTLNVVFYDNPLNTLNRALTRRCIYGILFNLAFAGLIFENTLKKTKLMCVGHRDSGTGTKREPIAIAIKSFKKSRFCLWKTW